MNMQFLACGEIHYDKEDWPSILFFSVYSFFLFILAVSVPIHSSFTATADFTFSLAPTGDI